MKIKPMTTNPENFVLPTRGSEESAGYDIYMPTDGMIRSGETIKVPLGFASEIPPGFVALLLPRSGAGFKYGVELNNTCGVIDSDFRGEWVAALKLKDPSASLEWKKGDRLLQFILIQHQTPNQLVLVDELGNSGRGEGGFGSTGK